MLNLLWTSLLVTSSLVVASPMEKRASCACGYKDEAGRIWREAILADFTSDYAGALSNFWPASEAATVHSGTTYAMEYSPSNIVQYNDGLGLVTRAYTGGTISSAEIDTYRSDILYGTFRMRAVIPTVPGVCFGFFSYHQNSDGSNVQETDIEFLSSDANYYDTIHYTNQPGNVNGVTDPNAAKVVTVSQDLTAFHNHRFDWMPTSSTFFVDGVQTSQITKNVPAVGSTLIANVWSDGGSGWTKGPPTQDAYATIYHINLYFNSTTLSESTFNSQCVAAGRPAACSVIA
ncbi:concanavalin A-like lectin/glucanase [Clavulina sp. PMI_390]|nr:concanavalin A-like lectin/glucanase [Clavulina sp. PMI_390]